MGSIIGSCIGGFFGFICCGACNKCSAHKTGPISRMPYIFLFFIAGIFALVMSLWGENGLNLQFTEWKCNDCKGNGSVYRVSFCLFAFELIHCLVIGFGAYQFHYLWFALKFLVFCIGLTLTFVLPSSDINPFMDNFSTYFSRYASAFYLLVQILILISWGYECNDYLRFKGNDIVIEAEQKEETPKCNPYYWALALGSLTLYILSYTFLGLFFHWYGGNNCDLHTTLISLTIIFVTLNGLISGIIGNGSFFVSAIVSFYSVFLLFAAIQADPNDSCNIYATNRNTSSLWIGWLLTFVALFYAALRADQIAILVKKDEEVEQPLLESSEGVNNDKEKATGITNDNDNDNDKDDDNMDKSNYDDVEKQTKKKKKNVNNDEEENDDDEDEPKLSKKQQKKSNFLFHMVMMLAACYFAMLFTNWGTNTSESEIGTEGDITLWINVACQWITVALFWWTMAAPYVCPSRFAQSED